MKIVEHKQRVAENDELERTAEKTHDATPDAWSPYLSVGKVVATSEKLNRVSLLIAPPAPSSYSS